MNQIRFLTTKTTIPKNKTGVGIISPSFIFHSGDNVERTKFNVDRDKAKRTYNGIVFDSQLEMKYYRDVILPQARSGHISMYELQKSYELQPKYVHNGKNIRAITYVADFYVEYADGSVEVIDTKGCPDSVAKIKKKMFEYQYPDISYRWIVYSKIDGGWCDYNYVKEQRRLRKKEKEKQKELKEI